jgi:hypothetical protein
LIVGPINFDSLGCGTSFWASAPESEQLILSKKRALKSGAIFSSNGLNKNKEK